MGTHIKNHDGLGDRALELAKEAGDTALDQANELGSKGMSALGDKLDTATDALTPKAKSLTGRSRRNNRAVEGIADKLHGAADYLRDEDPKSVLASVESAMIAHPYRTLLAGLGLGLLLAKSRR
jgi:hypothetical protein